MADWPSPEGISAAETQLRRLKDWEAMRRFAQIRLTALDNQAARFNGGAMDEWSGKLTVTSKKVTKISRRELATAGKGKWLLLLFEAELREGRVGGASDVAQRLIQEGDSGSRRKALTLAEEAKAPSLVELLRFKR